MIGGDGDDDDDDDDGNGHKLNVHLQRIQRFHLRII